MDNIGGTLQKITLVDAAGKLVDLQTIQAMMDSLEYYVFIVDEDHTIILANRMTSSALGKNPEELIGGFCPQLVHGVDEFPGCPMVEALATDTAVDKINYDEKHKIWLRTALYPLPFKTDTGKRVFLHTARDITEQKEASDAVAAGRIRLEEAFDGLIRALAHTLETKDPYTALHQKRVSLLSTAIAREYGFDKDRINGLNMAATIHDIGKIYVPGEILNKPGRLTPIEFELIKTHAEAGFNILKDIKFEQPVAQMVYQHHERLDGSGYPRGLSAADIDEGAKIMAVADVVEAMSAHRPYRAGLGLQVALDEITDKAGTLFDKEIVDICLALFENKNFSFSENS